MTALLSTFREIFGAAEADAAAVVEEFRTAATDIEKDIERDLDMALPRAFGDAIDRIKALLSGASDKGAADAQTIASLNSQVASLTQQLSDAQGQIADMTSALEAVAPAPAPDAAVAPAPSGDATATAAE